MRRHILAMGGAFLADPDGNLLLERYFKELTDHATPKILFIPTASGDNEAYSLRFFQAFTKLGCRPDVLPFFKRTPRNLAEFVLGHDAIAVGGGNTRTMFAVWRDWGLDALLKQAYERGIVLGGSSAGSICWFEDGVTDSIAGPLTRLACLGFLKGSNCPHYDSEKERRPTYQAMVRAGAIRDGYAADDGVGLHFIDGEFIQAVASKPRAMAWSVRRSQDGVIEEPIEPTRLG